MLAALNLLVGLGIFLFGMAQLERSIEAIGSVRFKQWLVQNTRHPTGSVFIGVAATALAQSSSMISLVVLAFASAGIIPLFNAVGVLLGANLGTTITGWIVATVGFKLELGQVALPAIGLGGLIQVFAERSDRWRTTGALVFGFGLLLFGLAFMKDAVGDIPTQFDIERLRSINALGYLLIGLVLTAIIQSSSATMMITLTALYSGIIELPGAAAIVIGADLGTTSTTLLGSLKGSIIKRQLALAHLVFNLVVDLLAFVLLLPLLPALLAWVHVEDPLYSLVAFHTCFNFLGLCLFIPLLKPYARWIGKRFATSDHGRVSLLDVPVVVPEAAISACSDFVRSLVTACMSINLRNLHIDTTQLALEGAAGELFDDPELEGRSFTRLYEAIKQREGDLLFYSASLQQQTLDQQQAEMMAQLTSCARDAVYAAKTLKDVRSNLIELRHAYATELQEFHQRYQHNVKLFYRQVVDLLAGNHQPGYIYEQLAHLTQLNDQSHQQMHDDIQQYSGQPNSEPEQVSTLLNINREVWHSGKNLLDALEHWFNAGITIGRHAKTRIK